MATKVFGASDDLIEFEGDVYGEYSKSDTTAAKPVHVVMSDGTKLDVCYGKPHPHEGVWWIRLIHAGPLFERIEECFDENADLYSDIAHFKDGLTRATCNNQRVR